MKWCRTLENEYGISYFKLLVSEEEFNENIEWYVGWAYKLWVSDKKREMV